ncbi:MAG: hydantoinase B/oxoprolinase family protein [Alphaproteobacteria bacterium]|nr:hydantoinase B/oxoprolinase family protein [Alphaproteobacteria bacterium]
MNGIDPITLSGVWYYLQRVCDEMQFIIERTARSYLIGQQHDLSVGIWDAEGRTLAIGRALPLQTFSAPFAIRALAEQYAGDIHPGDVFLTNDPYHGGHNNHLPDWGFIRPIFRGDKLKFFCLVRGHQQDTGGMYPGGYFPNAYDIIAEGLCIPPLRIIERGRENRELMKLIYQNVRLPDGVRMDNASMIAATELCDRRLTELLAKRGEETVDRCIDEMIARTETSMRAAIAGIPAGTYTGEAAMDDDGTVHGEPVWVRATVTIDKDSIAVDLSASDRQRQGFVNCVLACAYSGALQGVFMCLDPSLADFLNEGAFRPITVTAPPGLVVSAEYPATVGGMAATLNCVIESVLSALSQAIPDRAVAPWGRHRGVYIFGDDPRTGERYVRTYMDGNGSAGAVSGHDGDSGLNLLLSLALISRSNVEENEVRFPWAIEQLEFATDSMGAGEYRGGAGYRLVMRNEGSRAGIASGQADGDVMVGPGAQGGAPSPLSRSYLLRGDEQIPVPSKRLVWAQTGDRFVVESGGGAGVGNARRRDPALVAADVRSGLVSVEAARAVYGVVIDLVSGTVDASATAHLRGAFRTPRPESRALAGGE